MPQTNKKVIAGINGFGRFGLHLLKYWLDRSKEAGFTIRYINDDTLSLEKALEIMSTDKYVHFHKYKIQAKDGKLVILEPNGSQYIITYTNRPHLEIPWLGQPDIILECSGKNLIAQNCQFYLTNRVKLVVISATSWDADKTMVYGFNHKSFEGNERVISYGSCTVNAYVPLTNFIQKKYGIINSDMNVIHNIQEYRRKDNDTLTRKFCTLEKSGPRLLNFLNSDNFVVNYTVVPYSGCSMADFRYSIKKQITREILTADLEEAFAAELKGLYDFEETDVGPEVINCTTYSTVFIKNQVKVVNDQIYLQGYIDTENSVNRYFDLINYISEQNIFLKSSPKASKEALELEESGDKV